MKYYRPERTGQLIRDELSAIIAREIEFPLGVLVTLTNVIVTDDMEHATVRVSVLPADREKHAMKVLLEFRAHLQHVLNKKMNIRPMPQISFELDHGLENAAIVEKKLLDANNK